MREAGEGMVMQLENFALEASSEGMTETEKMELPSMPSVVYMDVNVVPEHDKERLEATISSLQAEMSELRSKQTLLDSKRREALNRILDLKGCIRVFCRVKCKDEKKVSSPISTEVDKITVRSAGTRKDFVVDRVFPPESTQDDVFGEVRPILRSALDGHNVCVLAYGQTGTGKTHTMEGTNGHHGIVPRAIGGLFHQISQDKSASFSLSMGMLEVYLGSLRDLFVHRPSARITHTIPKSNLSVLSSSDGTVEIEGLTDVPVTDVKQAHRWYARGKHARSTSWTNVNDASSRSHCLTRITITRLNGTEGSTKVISKLWLVDLGGSERLLKTGATGQTLDEGRAINLSLSALGDVIAALRMKRNHIPYRNSKLTQILSDSLGDGSKVLMLVHISPSEDDIAETICSLSFAKRARAVESSREVSEDLKKRKQQSISELEQQIQETEGDLQKVRNQIERIENLIQEKMKTLRATYLLHDDMNESPRSPLVLDHVEVEEGNKKAVKQVRRSASSVPRFMAPTECSRQRQKTSELMGRWRTISVMNRKSVDLFGSQSLNCSTPISSQNLKKRSVAYKRKDLSSQSNPLNISHNSIESKGSLLSKTKNVSTSNPNLRVALHQHRRRMSDLI
ncbi:kinesin-like protein KIN-1 isoform X3 [Canna indica]|uniref:Kinesin-like protein KIN-1 isoform X3 n=1 Tax=Canna indica TaxID=4628 RepID=A0AAQ3QBF6_9LILI|nr:kinesin-like protein KIN-1 isoform X3 [Canna indica]